MKLLISPLAVSDIEEIGDYIAQDNPARAISFMAEFEKQCQKANSNFPLAPIVGLVIKALEIVR